MISCNMNISRATKYEYLHVNSLMGSQAGTTEDDAKLQINMSGHKIQDIRNVAVKQFTINNSSFNITSSKDTIKWDIVRKKGDGIIFKNFSIKIPTGYYQSKDMIGSINEGPTSVIISLISETEMKKVLREGSPYSLVLKQNPDSFRVNVKATVGSGNSGDWWFVPLKHMNATNEGLWLDLGFDASHLTDESELSASSLASSLAFENTPGYYKMLQSYPNNTATCLHHFNIVCNCDMR